MRLGIDESKATSSRKPDLNNCSFAVNGTPSDASLNILGSPSQVPSDLSELQSQADLVGWQRTLASP